MPVATFGVARLVAPAIGLLIVAALSTTASAQPIKFFGQDPEFDDPPSNSIPANSSAEAARQRFLSNLGAISTEDFTGVTVTNPGTAAATFTFSFPGSSGNITGTGTGRNGNIITGDDGFGAFATSPTAALKASGSLVLTFSAPIGAFGAYVNDVETTDTILLILTPASGGPNVVLDFGGIQNAGSTGSAPGNGQLNFVGFIDTETDYDRIEIDFLGAANEGFGFDDFTIGDFSQVTGDQVSVTQSEICNTAGWRLLSPPVGPNAGTPATGVTLNTLGFENLVQGAAAGDGIVQQQYPLADGQGGRPAPNIYDTYGGGGATDYSLTATTGTSLEPGRGFWWYWFDQNIDPGNSSFGGGTSESVVLDNFFLSAIGTEVTTDVVRSYPDNTDTTPSPADDDFYLAGNPYAVPFDVATQVPFSGGTRTALTASGGTLQQCVLVWDPCDPGGATYKPIEFDGSSGPTVIAPWQGFFAEVTTTGGQVGGTIQLTYDADGRNPNATPTFVGRRAEEPRLALELRGTTASGAAVQDLAAVVRVVGDADDAWDAYDFSKPLPPSGSYAVVAPVGERDGETRYQAVLSVPAARTVPVAFQANEAGTYELSGVLTGGLQATLVDLETGAEHDLSSGAYAFEQGATFFRDRFEVRLSGGSVSTDEDAPETEVGVPYPNPVNGAARLSVRASESGVIAVDLFDTLGRRVARTVAPSSAGSAQHIDLPTNDLAPGVYTVRVSGAGLSAVRSLTVAR